MNESYIRGIIAQILAALMWIADFTGHSPVGTVLHDPATLTAVSTFIASAFSVWGIAEHLLAVYNAKTAKIVIDNEGLIAGH